MNCQDYNTTNQSSRLFEDITNTPSKRFKPNEDSTFQHSKAKRAEKKSLFQKLNDFSMSSARKEQKLVPNMMISEFQLPLQYKSSSGQKMDEELPSPKHHEPLNLALGRKMTCMDSEGYENALNTLNLYRSNSTFDQGRSVQDIKLGDNIYLRQINSVQGATAPYRTSMQCEGESRIDQDYEIQKNLLVHKKRHQNYICLNKLERIFYYVKKVLLDHNGQYQYESIQQMASEQVKIYHKDLEGCFLKFYQSWFEHNALYLTFEVAVQSLEDCTKTHKRLKEVEAWDLLRDCSKSLNWLSKQHGLSHMNIKPGNILKCQKRFKLADPFLQTSILQAHLKNEGNNWEGWNYLAPQLKTFYPLIEGLNMSQGDIYSLGMCIIENLVGEKYFPREGRALRLYIQKHIHGYSPLFMKTVMRMVSHDPFKRPTAEQLSEVGSNRMGSEEQIKKRRHSC